MRQPQAPWVEIPTLRHDPPRIHPIDRLITRARRRATTRVQRFARRSVLRLAYLWLSVSVALMMGKLLWSNMLRVARR